MDGGTRGQEDVGEGDEQVTSKHQRGNVKADANCTTVKGGVRGKARLLLPRRKSPGLCYDGLEHGLEVVGVLREELREKVRTKRLTS